MKPRYIVAGVLVTILIVALIVFISSRSSSSGTGLLGGGTTDTSTDVGRVQTVGAGLTQAISGFF